MKMEIRKRKMGMIQKETFWEELFYEVENKYACLTWEAPRKFPAEQKTDQQTVQRAVQLPAQLRNSNWLRNEIFFPEFYMEVRKAENGDEILSEFRQ